MPPEASQRHNGHSVFYSFETRGLNESCLLCRHDSCALCVASIIEYDILIELVVKHYVAFTRVAPEGWVVIPRPRFKLPHDSFGRKPKADLLQRVLIARLICILPIRWLATCDILNGRLLKPLVRRWRLEWGQLGSWWDVVFSLTPQQLLSGIVLQRVIGLGPALCFKVSARLVQRLARPWHPLEFRKHVCWQACRKLWRDAKVRDACPGV